jgi:hypothetical protein
MDMPEVDMLHTDLDPDEAARATRAVLRRYATGQLSGLDAAMVLGMLGLADNTHAYIAHDMLRPPTDRLCPQGQHPMTPDNAYVRPDTKRPVCRACIRKRQRANRAGRAA